MFFNLAIVIDEAGEGFDTKRLKTVIIEHLSSLSERFEFYFPTEDDPRIGKTWIRNPFVEHNEKLTVKLEDKILELAADQSLKIKFEIHYPLPLSGSASSRNTQSSQTKQ